VLPSILIAIGLTLCILDGAYKGDGSWLPLHTVGGRSSPTSSPASC